MSKYNGYASWPQWNVALWINNDEGLYRLAQSLLCRYSKAQAAVALLNMLHETGTAHTPDGAKYTVTSIRAALTGM